MAWSSFLFCSVWIQSGNISVEQTSFVESEENIALSYSSLSVVWLVVIASEVYLVVLHYLSQYQQLPLVDPRLYFCWHRRIVGISD